VSLSLDYILFIFIASLGVLQLSASLRGFSRLMLFRTKPLSYMFAAVCILGSFGWFFGWDDRLDEKIMMTGLEGGQQFFYFALSFFLALVFTLLLSSLRWRRLAPSDKDEEGLEALTYKTYLQAMQSKYGKRR
jgi:hypothetical protein